MRHIPRGLNLYPNSLLFNPLWSPDDLYEYTNEHHWESFQAFVILTKWVRRNRQVGVHAVSASIQKAEAGRAL